MQSLRIYLFGNPRLEIDGKSLDLPRHKGLALLAYLAVTNQARTREELATLLWPDNDPSSSLANLRRELSRLRQALGEGVLQADRQQVGFNPARPVWLDVVIFQAHVQAIRGEISPPVDRCEGCFERLTQAVGLYQGDFLAGFHLPDNAAFDEWQFFQAEGLRQRFAWALQWLIGWYVSEAKFELGIEPARRWLALDPLHESAHRQLMRLYAWGGQPATAIRQYQECVRLLREELDVEPEPETQTLYEAIHARQLSTPGKEVLPHKTLGQADQLAQDREDSPTVRKTTARLPVPVTGFIGREGELAEIYRLLEAETNCRLLTLIGPGGMGKTRLALEAAARLQPSFADGVYFVPLTSLGSGEEIVPAIIHALDLVVCGVADLKTHLLRYLADKQHLLILDNFESVVNDAGLLTEILSSAPRVKFLVTSRERLNLQSEWLLEVAGLDLPAAAQVPTLTLADLNRFGTTRLFLQRAHQALPNFQLVDADIPELLHICRLVGGMPLALEIAAAWVRHLPLTEIASQIASDLDFFNTQLRDIPERQRSLRLIIDQAWAQLDEQEQAILPRLTVFQGGFQFQAAEQVAGADLAQLARLADKALLASAGNGRYEMHELIES